MQIFQSLKYNEISFYGICGSIQTSESNNIGGKYHHYASNLLGLCLVVLRPVAAITHTLGEFSTRKIFFESGGV